MPTTKREKTLSPSFPFLPLFTFPLILWCYFRRLNCYQPHYSPSKVQCNEGDQREPGFSGGNRSAPLHCFPRDQ